MFRRVRFECGACGEGFVDWHDEEWERAPVFCVNCGEPIAAGAPVDTDAIADQGSAPAARQADSALGVLKGNGDGFRDTLRGLRVAAANAPPGAEREPSGGAAEATRSTTPGPFAKANSTAPRASVAASSSWAARRRRLAPMGALLLGFAAGIPLTLLAEEPVARLLHPKQQAQAELNRQLGAISSAIDDDNLGYARQLLERTARVAAPGDARVATLRARLTLGLILENRPGEARRELAAVQKLPPVHPAADELQHVYDCLYTAKPSAAASPAIVSASTAATPPKPVVTKRELLDFAHDRQRRSLLDDAQRLYEAVLRTHPADAEARCGLAEIQLLRGSVADAAALFDRALQSNGNYIPAWVGLGDIDWLGGRPERAACRYQAVIARFPNGSYPPYIAQRVARVASSGVNPPEARSDVSAPDACGN
ncbi:MAG TPA: tetratricopeptide repeat protein [Polyangiaceae bacterium]|jgi:tetratricopeptide (TPR) repeat protein